MMQSRADMITGCTVKNRQSGGEVWMSQEICREEKQWDPSEVLDKGRQWMTTGPNATAEIVVKAK